MLKEAALQGQVELPLNQFIQVFAASPIQEHSELDSESKSAVAFVDS